MTRVEDYARNFGQQTLNRRYFILNNYARVEKFRKGVASQSGGFQTFHGIVIRMESALIPV